MEWGGGGGLLVDVVVRVTVVRSQKGAAKALGYLCANGLVGLWVVMGWVIGGQRWMGS